MFMLRQMMFLMLLSPTLLRPFAGWRWRRPYRRARLLRARIRWAW